MKYAVYLAKCDDCSIEAEGETTTELADEMNQNEWVTIERWPGSLRRPPGVSVRHHAHLCGDCRTKHLHPDGGL